MRGIKRFTSSLGKKTKRVLVFCCLLFPTVLFAQNLGGSESTINERSTIDLLQKIIAVASWIWVIPASLAGKFMTNYFIYGESFYLTNYLFKFWQIIRTFAYFALGFYFLGNILYVWFNDKEAKSGMGDIIKNTVIAGFLIGGSRRLMAAAVDLSIVFTSAVASIPSQIYGQKRETHKQQCFNTPIQVDVKSDLTVDPVKSSDKNNRRPVTWEDVAPDGSNVAGPLTFFGSSVLGFFDMVFLPEGAKENNEIRFNSAAFVIVAVKAIMAFMLIVPLFVLVVVNLMRIVYLRIRIVFSPIIVLLNVFGLKISEGLEKYIDWKNILGLILQPVAVVGMLSIGLILVIELTSIFNLCVSQKSGDPLKDGSIAGNIKQSDNIPIGDELFEVTLGASLSQLGDTLGGVAGELILATFVIILLWSLIKIGFSFSELTAGVAKGIMESTEKMAGAIPFIKVPGMSGAVGLGTLNKLRKEGFGINSSLESKKAEQMDDILGKFGLSNGNVKQRDIQKLKKLAQSPTSNLKTLQQEITKQLNSGSISSTDAKDILKTWLTGDAKSLLENQKILNGINGISMSNIKDLTNDEINKIREDKTQKGKDARRLLNRLFSNGKINSGIEQSNYSKENLN